ncbi:MAG: sigma-70 family RNA polymerase sigma factor [Gemmataceae bacterium]|nr:sigma-70 family RNA polymerase sigma factor [Gemmataceae bacterium]
MTAAVRPDADREGAEAELVARLRAGDEDAYEILFRSHAGAMLAVARRYLGDTDEAADAVQDAFVSAFRAMPGFAGAARLGTWLHRITCNACLMKLRTRRRSRLVPLADHSPTETDPVASGAAALVQAETVAAVRDCVDKLPSSYRTVIRLRDLEGLDTDATAARLRTNSAVVKTRLHRARHALRSLLELELMGVE